MPEDTHRPGPDGTIPELDVGRFATHPRLEIELRRIAGEAGLERPLRHPRVQKNGLALAGHFHGVVPTRIQLLGETELSYLDALSHEARSVAARGFFALGLSCVVVTGGNDPPKSFIAAAEATATPLFVSNARSSHTINALHALLDDCLAPQVQLHGVLVDVYGVGVLLLGPSGIGKSECALALVRRDHRLVADDVVRCDWRPPGAIFGEPAELLRHHIEIRGLGVLDIRELFGVTSVSDRKQIDLVVCLCGWDSEEEFDRLGLDDRTHDVLGTAIREVRVPVRPGRDMASIVEMAARNELLRREGRHSAREFLARLEGQLMPKPEGSATGEQSSSGLPEARRSRGTWSTLAPNASGTESSAWIIRPGPPTPGGPGSSGKQGGE
ncbi:MAG: HPr(Ser) kinase/phosphatase [Polyangiaceae bacterium]|nr:HPr(Ser) kinase/phosphatase [Polyangiaceae bacterium]